MAMQSAGHACESILLNVLASLGLEKEAIQKRTPKLRIAQWTTRPKIPGQHLERLPKASP